MVTSNKFSTLIFLIKPFIVTTYPKIPACLLFERWFLPVSCHGIFFFRKSFHGSLIIRNFQIWMRYNKISYHGTREQIFVNYFFVSNHIYRHHYTTMRSTFRNIVFSTRLPCCHGNQNTVSIFFSKIQSLLTIKNRRLPWMKNNLLTKLQEWQIVWQSRPHAKFGLGLDDPVQISLKIKKSIFRNRIGHISCTFSVYTGNHIKQHCLVTGRYTIYFKKNPKIERC